MLLDRCLSVCLSLLSVCDVGVLWPNSWMNQNETWHSDRPRPRPYCVRWGPRLHQKMAEGHSTPNFGPCLLWPNGWVDQDETWHGGRPRPTTQAPLPKRGTVPRFLAHVCCGQTAGWMKTPLAREVDLGPGDIVFPVRV